MRRSAAFPKAFPTFALTSRQGMEGPGRMYAASTSHPPRNENGQHTVQRHPSTPATGGRAVSTPPPSPHCWINAGVLSLYGSTHAMTLPDTGADRISVFEGDDLLVLGLFPGGPGRIDQSAFSQQTGRSYATYCFCISNGSPFHRSWIGKPHLLAPLGSLLRPIFLRGFLLIPMQ